MIRAIPAILLLSSSSLSSGEWSDIEKKLPQSWAKKLPPRIAKQLNLDKVALVEVFRLKGWAIIHVGTYVDDDRFLFYKGDPLEASAITEWGGAAGSNETDEIKAWVVANAKGIPDRLASFFAWRVTKGHE